MLFGILLPYAHEFTDELGIIAVVAAIYYILIVAGMWKMFEKAGEAGWKAIIPFYNQYILYKISWQTKMFWIEIGVVVVEGLLYWIGAMTLNSMMLYIAYGLSMVDAIIQACLCYNIALAFGHGLGYFLGIYLLNFVFYPIIGFGPSRYLGNRYDIAAAHHVA